MRNCPLRVVILSAGLIASIASAGGSKSGNYAQKAETLTESKSIPSKVEYQFSRSVGKGRLVKVREGRAGRVNRIYSVTRKNGKIVTRDLLQETRLEPKTTLFHMGRTGWKSSRAGFSRGRVLVMSATGYDPSPLRNGGQGRVRLGWRAGYGQVAVDPRVIPLRSLLYVEGYGFAIASDIGGAIKGNRIDLCFSSYGEAMRFGRKKMRVHILRGR